MDALNDSHPKLMEELVPKLLTLGEVGRVLEQLLRERVSIRDLGAILEALLETAPRDKSLEGLVEAARQAMGRRLVQPLLDGDGQLPVLLLDPALEDEILATVSPETGQRLLTAAAAPGTPLVRRLIDSVNRLIGSSSPAVPPVLLVPSPARYHVKRWLEPVLPRLAVVAAERDSARDPAAAGGNGALKWAVRRSAFGRGMRSWQLGSGKRVGNGWRAQDC